MFTSEFIVLRIVELSLVRFDWWSSRVPVWSLRCHQHFVKMLNETFTDKEYLMWFNYDWVVLLSISSMLCCYVFSSGLWFLGYYQFQNLLLFTSKPSCPFLIQKKITVWNLNESGPALLIDCDSMWDLLFTHEIVRMSQCNLFDRSTLISAKTWHKARGGQISIFGSVPGLHILK